MLNETFRPLTARPEVFCIPLTSQQFSILFITEQHVVLFFIVVFIVTFNVLELSRYKLFAVSRSH